MLLVRAIKKQKLMVVFFLFWVGFYLFFQLKTIYGGDAGDLVASAVVVGIPHAPGYPLYTFLAYLLSKLPLFTPAWRVGLLSSIPAASALTFLFLIIKKITKNTLASLVAVLVLGFNYTFWLYAEVAEVFSLNNFLAVLLIWLFLKLDKEKTRQELKKYLLIIFLVVGFSFTHHHTILFLFPGFLYLVNKKFKSLKSLKIKDWLVAGLFFLVGLTPLLYLPLSALKTPAIDWGHPVNLSNFLRLFFRVDYGTFRSSVNLGNQPLLRLAAVISFFKFVIQDFWILGVILMVLGLAFLWKNKKDIFWFLVIDLAFLVFFIFYASYILANDFMVATFERFMLLPYIVLTIIIGCGLAYLFKILKKLSFHINRSRNKFGMTKASLVFRTLFLLYPLAIFASNYPKISILKNDFTAENLAKDILDSLPKDSILLLSTDTTLFNTQYYYYAFNYRPDVKLIHFYKLYKDFYKKTLRKYYPNLILPEGDGQEFVDRFVADNKEGFPIFTTAGGKELFAGRWIPYGLLLGYFKDEESTPAAQLVLSENKRLWQFYHDPFSGSLKHFKNLYLADILRVYSEAHKKTGEYFLDQGFLDRAEDHFEQMIRLNDKDIEGYMFLGRVFLAKKECHKAEENFKKMLELNPDDVFALAFLRKTYLECFQDEQKAKEFEDSCLQEEEKGQIKLKDL